MLKAYVLLETLPGSSPDVLSKLRKFKEMREVHRVSGPYDLIAVTEALDMQALSSVLEHQVQNVPGVRKTITCLVVPSAQ